MTRIRLPSHPAELVMVFGFLVGLLTIVGIIIGVVLSAAQWLLTLGVWPVSGSQILTLGVGWVGGVATAFWWQQRRDV